MLDVTAAIIRQNNRVLICQRPEGKHNAMLWEFPGGKIEPGETGEACVIRECQEELGLTLRVLGKLTTVQEGEGLRLHFYLAEILSGTPTRREHRALRWVTAEELPACKFCPADARMLRETDLRSLI